MTKTFQVSYFSTENIDQFYRFTSGISIALNNFHLLDNRMVLSNGLAPSHSVTDKELCIISHTEQCAITQ